MSGTLSESSRRVKPRIFASESGRLDARALFARHLDLAPLRGRPRGLVRCVLHQDDRRASLSIDLNRGLFNCFACGAHGGVRRFAELVGEVVAAPPPKRISDSPIQAVRREAAWLARQRQERAEESRPWNVAADFIRRAHREAERVRELACILGPEHPRVWAALEGAARVEREALAVEAALDRILASGRVA